MLRWVALKIVQRFWRLQRGLTLGVRAIIIDAPPFFAAPETFSLAKASDGVVLILRAGVSRHPAVNALVSDLDQLGIPVLGTVLNYRQYPIPQWLLRFT